MPLAFPAPDMLEAAEKIARFMETLNDAMLEGAFAGDATIIENFPPHIFAGEDAVKKWAAGFRKHAEGLSELRHEFGAAQDFSVRGDLAFFTLPTRWNGLSDGAAFAEQGGWAFVLIRQAGAWRVAAYAWAVTDYSQK